MKQRRDGAPEEPAIYAKTTAEHTNLGSATNAASGYVQNANLSWHNLTFGLTRVILEATARLHEQMIGSAAPVLIREFSPKAGGGTHVGTHETTGFGTKGATVNKHSDNLKARFCCDSRNAVAGLMSIWGR